MNKTGVSRFKPWVSGVRSDRSTNCATGVQQQQQQQLSSDSEGHEFWSRFTPNICDISRLLVLFDHDIDCASIFGTCYLSRRYLTPTIPHRIVLNDLMKNAIFEYGLIVAFEG